jgi:hypothetical protein
MIYPLLPMRFTGATWYQGEANAGEMQGFAFRTTSTFSPFQGDPATYTCHFPSMIAGKRSWATDLEIFPHCPL